MERFCIFGNSASACESVGNCLKADGADICIFVSKNVNRLASEAKKYLKSERKPVLVMTNRELTSATAIFSKSGIYDLYVCPCDLPANRPVPSAKSSDIILHIDNSKPRLRMIDAEIFSKCNQNCIACTHFSSLTGAEDHVTVEELERDFTKLHDFFWGIERIDLLGGEPLMNTRVNEYIYMTHRIFPDADIHVATNGLLIPTVADKLPKNLNNYNCELSITQYPTTAKIKDVIKDKLNSNHIPYETSKTRRIFFKTLFEQPQKASRRFAYKCCMLKPCNGLFRGHISTCTAEVCLYRLKAKYPEIDIPDETANIYNTDMDGWELLDYLENRSTSLCDYCYIGWEPIRWEALNSKKPKKSDWFIKDDFFHRVIMQYAFIAASPLIKLLYRTMHIVEDKSKNR